MITLGKRHQQHIDRMKWPVLLVLKEKHDTDYILVKDVEALWRACLDVLEGRMEVGYINNPNEPYVPYPEYVLTPEQLEVLPPGIKEVATKRARDNKKWHNEFVKLKEIYEDAKQSIDGKDGKAAYLLLLDRDSYEYEGFEMISVCEA